MNIVILSGNVGKTPEVRHTNDNKAIASFSIATRGFKKDETDWHNCVAFGKTAEIIGEHVTKGQRLDIQGRLQTRKWQDKEGKDRYTTEVIVEKMEFAGKSDGKKPAEAPARQVEDNFDDMEAPPF